MTTYVPISEEKDCVGTLVRAECLVSYMVNKWETHLLLSFFSVFFLADFLIS